MGNVPKRIVGTAGFGIGLALVVAMVVLAVSRSSSPAARTATPIPVLPSPSDFVTRIDNKYFPLRPGTTFSFRGTQEGKASRVTVFVTHKTKSILGIRAVVVLDQVFVDGKREEKTFDWYAQDRHGNVWYLGEDSSDFANGKWVRSDGSWEAGVKGAKAGIVMKANPSVGDVYRQEYYAGHAEDMAKVLSEQVRLGSVRQVRTHSGDERVDTPRARRARAQVLRQGRWQRAHDHGQGRFRGRAPRLDQEMTRYV